MNDQAVIESFDTGADLSDTGGTQSSGATEAAHSADAGANNAGKAVADAGTAAAGAGSDSQSASGGAAEGKEAKLVPIAALHESRQEVRALQAKIAALEARPHLTEAQQKQLEKLQAQEQAATDKDPDFLEDPKGYIDTKLTKTQEALKKLDEATAARAKQDEATREFQTLVGNLSARESEFIKTTPDYNDALNHVRTVRTSQLQLMYPNATPQQIQAQIGMEEIQGAKQILQSGGDPISFVYNYAKTLGYAPKAAAAAATGQSAANAQKAADKDAARTLGGGGTGDSTPDESDDEAAAMSPFNEALAEKFGVKKRR